VLEWIRVKLVNFAPKSTSIHVESIQTMPSVPILGQEN